MTSPVFNVCYLVPVFKDVAEVIYHGLTELGATAYFHESAIVSGARNIVFGSHLIVDRSALPADSIIFNLEQLGSGSHYCTEQYFDSLRTHTVWDYSRQNIALLRQNNINPAAQLVSIGYSPKMFRIPKAEAQDIDVLFYGALNERRDKVLDALRAAGLNVISLGNAYGKDLDAYVARSKIVLNLHFHETKIFEVVRVSYLLNNKKAVVSEVGHDTEIDDDLREAVAGVEYEELVDACIKYVRDDPLRMNMEENGFQVFSARLQASLLRDAVLNLSASA